MADWNDYYEVLGVDPSAATEDIDRAWRRKALEVHPDHNKSPDATEQMKLVNQAREALNDPAQRAQFDKEWTFRNTPPLPVVEPQAITFNDVTPGEVQHGFFVVSNKGGIYDDFSAQADDRSWIGFVGTESTGQQEDLPAKVTFAAVAQDWGENLANTIRVRLDEAEAVVRVSLHAKTRPKYAGRDHTAVAANPAPAYAPSSPPYSAPTYRTPTVTVPKRKSSWANRRVALLATLLVTVAAVVGVAGSISTGLGSEIVNRSKVWDSLPAESLPASGVTRVVFHDDFEHENLDDWDVFTNTNEMQVENTTTQAYNGKRSAHISVHTSAGGNRFISGPIDYPTETLIGTGNFKITLFIRIQELIGPESWVDVLVFSESAGRTQLKFRNNSTLYVYAGGMSVAEIPYQLGTWTKLVPSLGKP